MCKKLWLNDKIRDNQFNETEKMYSSVQWYIFMFLNLKLYKNLQ